MKNILGTFIIAYLAFAAGGYYVKDEAIKYIDGNCNTVHIIETQTDIFMSVSHWIKVRKVDSI